MSIEPLGLSVYISTFEQQRAAMEKLRGEAVPVFLSLHISEEFGEAYCQKAETACRWLTGNGFRIIADVSPKAAVCFGEQDVAQLAERLGIWALRLDYGFSAEEICRLAQKLPLVLNASTVSDEVARQALRCNRSVMAMHNFYPRLPDGADKGAPGPWPAGAGLCAGRYGLPGPVAPGPSHPGGAPGASPIGGVCRPGGPLRDGRRVCRRPRRLPGGDPANRPVLPPWCVGAARAAAPGVQLALWTGLYQPPGFARQADTLCRVAGVLLLWR